MSGLLSVLLTVLALLAACFALPPRPRPDDHNNEVGSGPHLRERRYLVHDYTHGHGGGGGYGGHEHEAHLGALGAPLSQSFSKSTASASSASGSGTLG